MALVCAFPGYGKAGGRLLLIGPEAKPKQGAADGAEYESNAPHFSAPDLHIGFQAESEITFSGLKADFVFGFEGENPAPNKERYADE